MFTKVALPLIVLFLSLLIPPQESHAQVTGRVRDANNQPIPQVNIVVQNTNRGTQTNIQGEYTITAYPGDILFFSHLGMQSEEVSVKKNASVINVRMTAASIEIEEVEIKTKAKTAYKSQKELLKEFPANKNLIKTTWGILDKDLSSTFFRIVDGEDLIPVGTDFFFSFEAHIPQLQIIRDDPEYPGVHVYLRGSEPVFDVDGFVTPAPPTYLSAIDIDRIAVLERSAAIMRYGPQGAKGVIVINTKSKTWMDDMGVDRSEEHRQLLDSAMKVTHLELYRPYVPAYLEKLQKVRSEKKALEIVDGQQDFHLSNPYYFLDLYELFSSRWGHNEKSKELAQYIIDNFSENISVLKALAYQHQQYAYYSDALSLYLKILTSQSWYAQALRDVANAYAEAGEFEKAWMYYSQYIDIMDQLPNASFDAYGEDQLITTEMLNILERSKVVFSDRDTIMDGTDNFDQQTRLVFEWNNPEAEFDLQFVSPEGYYDSWSNKTDKEGYSSHQFFIGEENVGTWQVNIDYKGNDSDIPTYLKVSVFRDYGLPSQKVDITVYKLYEMHKKVQLFTCLIGTVQ